MKCSFCGEELEKGEGKLYITEKGERHFYCSSKCEKNHRKLDKKPRDVEWVQKSD